MAVYQLWSPWTPLDESLQWIRRTTPKPCTKHPFRTVQGSPHTVPDVEVQLSFEEMTLFIDNKTSEPGLNPHMACQRIDLKSIRSKKDIIKPQPVHLRGLDFVFGSMITIQAPKWTGAFRVSEKSAFSKIISHECLWPSGLKEPQIKMAVHICKQLLRGILLLYATYKKCSFALQRSK
ncbi:FANCD2 opposite strand protein [Discoglossus pictus]